MIYERRIAHAHCYNGYDYDRPIAQQNCPCEREDFEWYVQNMVGHLHDGIDHFSSCSYWNSFSLVFAFLSLVRFK